MTGTGKKKSPGGARFITPPNILKQKVGTGGIDEALLNKSQAYIEKNKLDFNPIARDFLKEFSEAIKKARSGVSDPEQAIQEMIAPIMQLKANGGMFRYQLISDVADIALQFLESIHALNKDAYEVLEAHEKTIQVIILNKLTGDGGSEGYALVKELHQACLRYFSKYKKAAAKKAGK